MHTLHSVAETEAFSRNLAAAVKPGMVIGLVGDLGAGKSVCVRAAGVALGITDRMPSPSYTLVEEYRVGETVVFHIDLYRLADAEEFYLLGVEERFGEAITFIEWIDRAPEIARRADVIVEFSIDHDNGDYRTVRVRSGADRDGAA
ncbi:MAG: tRNA (adenosine(37)-N6)-threonylcarbamoyltransferase complex ATPase subunit type 1 TsaE [Spirochaeta sp.]|nr:tRNA (adenosine(37)-N6)-threonylcarbamoyltransferase complex ATPase subunit type 1 TsaE [Spirochaeta sp.]